MPENMFSRLSDDVILNIFFKLEEDPRSWPRLACVSTKFSALIWDVCCKSKCCKTMPSVVTDLLFGGGAAESPPLGGWAALYKLAVSCPGALQAGVLLENSDFGLQRELGPEESFQRNQPPPENSQQNQQSPVNFQPNQQPLSPSALPPCLSGSGPSDVEWSLYDDLYNDTVYDVSESGTSAAIASEKEVAERDEAAAAAAAPPPCKKRKICTPLMPHLAKGVLWNLSREQGNKLLAPRFKGDCLYICDWPGCVHSEEKRNYMLFRGIFKNFKQSRVWRTINDGHRSKIEVNCAFCSCKETWDLHSAFCLRRHYGFHDDGEPVVRAYVCENGHVSGAWTDWPLYT